MNFYSHHLGDYAAATRHLSMLEHGAYRLLLDTYYTREQPFPADEAMVCRLAGARSEDEREAVRTVLREFFTLGDDGWRHSRCDAEIERMREKSDKARQSVAQRKDRSTTEERSNNERSTNVDRPYNEGSTTNSQEPIANSQGKAVEQSRGARLPADFPDAEAKAWARQERPDLDPDGTADQFRDYWVAQPGAKGRKADWPATWRNWVRTQRGTAQARASPARPAASKYADTIAQLTGRTLKDDPNVIDIAPAALRLG